MIDQPFHVPDEDLLRIADGELSNRRSIQIRTHLEACWLCRARIAKIERSIGEFVRVIRESSDPDLPPIDRARARLKTRFDWLAENSRPGLLSQVRAARNHRGLGYALALLLLLALGTGVLYRQIWSHEGLLQSAAYAEPLPNPALTPGATGPASLTNLCSQEHDQVVGRVPEGVRQQVFREYGITGAAAGDFEIDHLVTPGLGGSDDLRNLWPEPRYRTPWNSYVKDQLEDHLHHLVCSGQVSLATAQRDIATDWISAYRKYFHTDDPLLPYSSSAPPSFTLSRVPASGTSADLRPSLSRWSGAFGSEPFLLLRGGPGTRRASQHPSAQPWATVRG
jgi:hypothetical protein